MYLKEFREHFNPKLAKILQHHVADFNEVIADPIVASFMDQAATITLAGGKRIRPYLVDLMYRTAGGSDSESIVSIVVGIELFHMFCLIHDDVIDFGELRHHTSTVHVFATQTLADNQRLGDLKQTGRSQAILVGDQFMAWAMECILALDAFPPHTQTAIKNLFFTMVQEVIAGQLLDVDLTTRPSSDISAINRKGQLKTASYTFIRPLLMGRTLATPSDRFDTFIKEFGTHVGMAFQLQDDLVDWTNQKTNSKTHLADISERQHTLIRQHITTAGALYASRLNELEAKNNPDPQALYALADQSGALTYAKSEVQRLLTLADQALSQVDFSAELTKEWIAIIEMIRNLQNG
jgi:geranylgeranyl diphosphate synthase type I